MALEDATLIGLALISFLPTFIAGTISEDQVGFKFIRYSLYSLSIFLGLLTLQAIHLALERAFGVAPTTTENNILSIVTGYNTPIITFFIFFAMLLALGIIVYLINYIASRKIGKTE